MVSVEVQPGPLPIIDLVGRNACDADISPAQLRQWCSPTLFARFHHARSSRVVDGMIRRADQNPGNSNRLRDRTLGPGAMNPSSTTMSSSSMSVSTPRKPSSRLAVPSISDRPLSSHSIRLQKELKALMQNEIADQTFSFPSHELAHMLSPKTPKPGVKSESPDRLLRLDQYRCTVDDPPFRAALDHVVAQLETFRPQPSGSPESASYPTLARFLTNCVKACHDALDSQTGPFAPRQERWYAKLEFIPGRRVKDRVDHASPLWPDISGGNDLSAAGEEQLYWKPPPEKFGQRVMLPVEVKSDWRVLVSQAATYARSLFSANPARIFALVIGFNHVTNTLRFLVFHHGGLTASDECNITEEDGLREVAHLFLTLASWTTAEEAGFVTCYNHTAHLLPKDQSGTGHVSAEVEKILARSHCVRGRMTFVYRLRLPTAPKPVRTIEKSPTVSGTRRSPRFSEKAPTSSRSAGSTTTPRETGEQTDGPFFFSLTDNLRTNQPLSRWTGPTRPQRAAQVHPTQ